MGRLSLKHIFICNRRRALLGAVLLGGALAWGASVVHLPSVVTTGVQVTGATASTAPVFDSSKNLVSSSTTTTELGYVHGVTSALCGINQSCTLANKSIDGGSNTITGVSLSTSVTGTLPIGNGGTGQTTATAAFDALSPLTSAGDMLTYASGHNARVGTVLADVGKFWASGGALVPNSWSSDGSVLTNLNASNIASGTLAAARGGTGQTTALASFQAFYETVATTLGDLLYGGASGVPTRLAGNATTTPKMLVQTGTGSASAAPAWQTDGNFLTNLNASNIATGTVPAARLPNPSSSSLGGVQSAASASHQWINAISTSGVPALSQPAMTDISGTCTVAQGCVALTTAAVGDIIYGSATNTWSKLTGNTTTTKQFLSSTGTGSVGQAPAWGQPAMTDISGTLAINAGGTGQTSQTAAFDALSPLTSAGDMLVYASGHNARVGTVLGDVGKVWVSGGALVPNSWSSTLDAFTLTNMNMNYGAASNTQRLVLPSNTTTTLAGLTNTAALIAYDSTQGKPVFNNGSGWTTIGTGSGSGGVNFILNPDAETDTSGWATYSNTAQATPVSGTGGSPTVTWTRTASTPLTGTGSFLFTKDAANRQGQGASYDFAVDNASQARVMSIDFDYQVASGTFVAGASGVDSDIEIYVYDITNSTLIQPSTYKLFSSATSPPSHFSSTFQTASNSTSYRLIFHTATTSASAYTVKFDSVTVAPSKYVYGTPITDWLPYTVAITGSSANPTKGTTSIDQGYYRRAGDSIEIIYMYQQTVAGTAGTGTYLFSLPSGITLDTTKIASTQVGGAQSLGSAVAEELGTPKTLTGSVFAWNSTQLAIQGNVFNNVTPLAQLQFMSATQVALSNTAVRIGFHAVAPVLGWSSSVQMSDNASVRSVVFAGTQTSQALTGAVTNLTLTATTDSVGGWATNIYTVQVAGDYLVSGNALISGSGAMDVFKNGAHFGYFSSQAAGESSAGSLLLSGLVAGDTISIRCSQSLTITSAHISIFKLSSPASISATETVAAKYNAFSTTVGTTLATVTGGTLEFDTHGGFNPGTGLYTCPVSGIYRVSASLGNATANVTAAALGVIALEAAVVKNGSGSSVLGIQFSYSTTSSITSVDVTGSTIIKCAAGDTLGVQVLRNTNVPSYALSGSANGNWISFERINGAGG